MKKYLLSENGNFYKANLHCHTTVSDGKKTPEEIKKMYKAKGYSAVAFTDHDIFIPHNELTDSDFVALAGFELQYNKDGIYPSGKDIPSSHFCFIAKSPDIDLHPDWSEKHAYIGNSADYKDKVKYEIDKISVNRHRSAAHVNYSVKKAVDAGFFVTYNHPVWSLDDYEVYTKYEGMHAMEIFNNDCHTIGYTSYVPHIYDDMLKSGKKIFAVAADDNHNKFPEDTYGFDSFGGFTMIKAEELSYEALTDALFAGDFYASQGPEIYDLYVEYDRVYITSSDAVSITFNSGRRSAKVEYAKIGETINSASFAFDPKDSYFRLTVTDKNGKCANTNAYFIEDL